MPNTLAHIGLQLPLTRALIPAADPRWVALGLMIPDFPWILQRALICLPTGLDPSIIRAFAVIQVSPFGCALLCGSIAMLFRRSGFLFLILFSNSLLHLFLDAAEQKGGVGIPFLVPFHWDCHSFPFFEMDGSFVIILTLLGLGVTIWLCLRKHFFTGLGERAFRSGLHTGASAILLVSYFAIPMILLPSALKNNVHDTGVWSGTLSSEGRTVSLDRARFLPGDPAIISYSVAPGPMKLMGVNHDEPALISGIARFSDEQTLVISEWTLHPVYQRFSYSLTGLLAVILIWLVPFLRSRRKSGH